MFLSKMSHVLKFGALALLAGSFVVACGNNNNGDGAVAGVNILSINSGVANTYSYGGTALTVMVGDNSGNPAQSYTLNVSPGMINGDLRQIGQNVYELQATCATQSCSDVALMIVARHGFTNTGTFNTYLNNTLSGDGVNYPASATTGYVLTTQPLGSIEFLYRATGSTTGVAWTLIKSLVDNTGQISLLTQTQITALETP